MSSTATLRIARDPAAPSTVLVVDDDELMRAHLAAVLKFAGYSVQAVASAGQALQVLEQSDSCLVLADWEMPDMDGLALCRAIRERQDDSYIYVLMLTVRGAPADIIEGFSAGADDYLVKGHSAEELIARLESGRRIIAHYRSSRERMRRSRNTVVTAFPLASPPARAVRARLASDYERCREHGAPLSALACGIDYLDCVADRFGASVAERLLASIRQEIGKLLLEMDWVVSLDESTVLVVLPHATLEAARHVAERARALVADGARFSTGIPLTASVGVAALERPGDFLRYVPMSLVNAALQSLEQSRHQGGDSVTAAHVWRSIS